MFLVAGDTAPTTALAAAAEAAPALCLPRVCCRYSIVLGVCDALTATPKGGATRTSHKVSQRAEELVMRLCGLGAIATVKVRGTLVSPDSDTSCGVTSPFLTSSVTLSLFSLLLSLLSWPSSVVLLFTLPSILLLLLFLSQCVIVCVVVVCCRCCQGPCR